MRIRKPEEATKSPVFYLFSLLALGLWLSLFYAINQQTAAEKKPSQSARANSATHNNKVN